MKPTFTESAACACGAPSMAAAHNDIRPASFLIFIA
jgi:hypothetical protein